MGKKLALVVVAVAAIGATMVWKIRQHVEVTTTSPPHAVAHCLKVARAPRPLAAPVQVSGHVTTKSGPVAGATVALVRADLDLYRIEPAPMVATTDASGAWTIENLPPGEYVASAAARGFVAASQAKVTSTAGGPGIDLGLEPGGTAVRGTVRDAFGRPIASALVAARESSMRAMTEPRAPYVAVTDAAGAYELSLPDGGYSLTIHHDAYALTRHSLEVAGTPSAADFKLVLGGTIHGVVVARATGAPVPGAFINARGPDLNSEWRGEATARADGTFVLHGVLPGAISLEASAAGVVSLLPSHVGVASGEAVDNVRVVVDNAVSICGRVVETGTRNGIAGASVYATGVLIHPHTLDPTGADGAFEIVGVKRGSNNLSASAETKIPATWKQVEVGDTDVTGVIVELAAGATLTGRVDPPGKATIRVATQDELGVVTMQQTLDAEMIRGTSDASGVWKLEHVPAEKLVLLASTAAGPGGTYPIDVTGTDQTGIVIPLEKRASVSGRVVDTNGAPVAGLRVIARPDRRTRARMVAAFRMELGATSGADGAFTIVGLEPGGYRITSDDKLGALLAGADQTKWPKLLDITAGSNLTGAVVTVPACDGVIRGVVTAGGKPARDAWVKARFQPPDHKPIPSVFADSELVPTDASGTFAIDQLRAGTYTLVAEGPCGASRGEVTDVKLGDTTTIALQPYGSLAGHVTMSGAQVTSYELECQVAAPLQLIDQHVDATDGAYALDHLAPNRYWCRVSAPAGSSAGQIDVAAGAATLDLALVPWSTVIGTTISVLDGRPVPELYVSASGAAGGAAKVPVTALFGATVPVSDTHGRFTIVHVGDGPGYVSVSAPWVARPLASKTYTAVAGDRIDVGAVFVVPQRTGAPGTLGIEVGDALDVKTVVAGSPAELAGIVAGDKITGLQNHSIVELTPEVAKQLLQPGTISAGQTLTITLARGTTLSLTAATW